ncbi:hypothetical protein LCGC14_2889150 [marine sediment metagenome]|uniref:Uncharacterized protein n=1 Tax=marine sediment metagenome TaxID=412755 RepID=A0A0F9ANY9_9ZZZZ
MAETERILEVESFGLLLESDSVDQVKKLLEPVLLKLGEEVEFDYRRFQSIAARLMWEVRIRDFEFIDNVLIKLRKAMEKYFDNWGIRIIIKYTEGG